MSNIFFFWIHSVLLYQKSLPIYVSNRRKRNEDKKSWIFTFFPYSSESKICIFWLKLEGQTAVDSGFWVIAEHQGKILYTDSQKIPFSRNGNTESIPLVKYQGSNKKTLIHQKPRVQRGKCVKKGQILADGAATVDGELALGKNILVAYMPWEGYNSEDAVLISERLIYEDIFTSFSIRRYEIKTYMTNQLVWYE